jgi:hypothetical protein
MILTLLDDALPTRDPRLQGRPEKGGMITRRTTKAVKMTLLVLLLGRNVPGFLSVLNSGKGDCKYLVVCAFRLTRYLFRLSFRIQISLVVGQLLSAKNCMRIYITTSTSFICMNAYGFQQNIFILSHVFLYMSSSIYFPFGSCFCRESGISDNCEGCIIPSGWKSIGGLYRTCPDGYTSIDEDWNDHRAYWGNYCIFRRDWICCHNSYQEEADCGYLAFNEPYESLR